MSTRPHIVFVITDQQRYDTVAALGASHMRTRTLDRLVSEGCSLDRCYVAGASCVPARGSLFTGYYPHTTGILRNGDTWRHGWVQLLGEAGYTCINVGKMHTWPLDERFGFTQRHVVENKDRFNEARYFFDDWDRALATHGLVKQQRSQYRLRGDYRSRLGAFEWKLPPELHSDEFVGERACWWIRSHPKVDSLFLQIGFPGPHPPYDPTPAALAALDTIPDDQIPIDAVRTDDLAAQPKAFASMRAHNEQVDHDSVVHDVHADLGRRLRQRRHYLANVQMIDAALGRIVEALAAKGYLDDAIIVFTSDHGDCLGDHGHSQKWTMYEQVTRVPMIVWSPGRVSAGVRSQALVQQMDIAPWLLEQAGAAQPPGCEAISLEAAWRDAQWKGRDAVYAEQTRDGVLREVPFMTMVRTPDWKLVHLLDADDGQLFDLQSDPGEIRNLWDDPLHLAKRRELCDGLLRWRIHSQLRTKDRLGPYR